MSPVLAQHQLLSCVHSSVHQKLVWYRNSRMDQVHFFAQRLPSSYPILYWRGIRVSAEISTFLWNFVTHSGLGKIWQLRMSQVLLTEVDAQCDKLATIVGCVQPDRHKEVTYTGLTVAAYTCCMSIADCTDCISCNKLRGDGCHAILHTASSSAGAESNAREPDTR